MSNMGGSHNRAVMLLGCAIRETRAAWKKNTHDILDEIYDGYFHIDLRGIFVSVNLSLCEMLGYKRDELIDVNYYAYTDESTFRQLQHVCRALYQTGMPVRGYGFEHTRRDGKTLFVEASMSLVRDGRGRKVGYQGIVRNITDRKLVEDSLRFREKRIRDLMDAIPDCISYKDADGRILWANENKLNLHGLVGVPYIGKTDFEVADDATIDPDVLRRCAQSDETAWQNGSRICYEEAITHPDGTVKTLDVVKVPMYSDAGERRGLLVIGRDVTVRKQTERRLAESEQRYRSLMDCNKDAVISLDVHGHILSANGMNERITGYCEAEMIGEHFSKFLADTDLETALRHFTEAVAGTASGHGERMYRCIHKKGRRVEVSVKSMPIVVNHEIVGIYSILKDMTERNRLERENERLSRQNELILSNAGEGICGVDIGEHIIFCNPAMLQMTGYALHEVLGQQVHELFHHTRANGEPCLKEDCQAHRAFTERTPTRIHNEVFWRKDGTCFPVEYVITPTIENGKMVGAVMIVQDVTERKRADEMLLKSAKLSAVGELAAGVAHEIRNPLTALKGFVQLLEAENGGRANYFDIMKSELSRIESIVNEFLALAKPQPADFKLHRIDVVLANVIRLLEMQAIVNNVQIDFMCNPSVPLIHCDENRLKQVFVNLLKNAIEAMPTGGHVKIRVDMEEQDWEGQDGERLRIRILDEGAGIPDERLSDIGVPFFTTKEHGTGLGLMVSQKIVEAHHGRMHLDSVVGKGTVVDIWLPVPRGDAAGYTH